MFHGKSFLIIVSLGFMLISMISCSNPYSSPTSTYENYAALVQAGNKEKWLECYSEETQKLMVEVELKSKEMKKKLGNKGSDDSVDQMKEMAKTEQPKIIKETITGDTATLTMKSEHGEHELTFIKEKGNWKIDMSKELRSAVEMFDQIEQMQKGMKQFLGSMTSKPDDDTASDDEE